MTALSLVPVSAARRAFTLIELLVSMSVTLLLVVALMQIFNAAANTWQHGEAQVDAYREARGALQLMARDLSATLSASYAQTVGTTPASFSPALPTLVLQHAPTYEQGGGPVNEEVYCLTNIPDDQAFPTPTATPAGSTTASGSTGVFKMSSLCAVGYYCQWLPDASNASNTPHAYALMRQSLRSNDTFQRIQAAQAAQAASATPGPLSFDNLFSQTGSPAPFVNQLAAYVWDLRFRIDTDLNEQTTPDGNLPSPGDHSSPQRFYNGTPGTPYYPPNLPPYLEIRFKALSDIAGRRLEGSNSGVQKGDWLDNANTVAYRTIIQPNAQQFVLRVPLINAASVSAATPTPTP